jgi:hypothetical protein
MPEKVSRKYRLSMKEKAIVEAWAHREIKSKEAADAFGVRKQNFPTIAANILRDMIEASPEFGKAFVKQLKSY